MPLNYTHYNVVVSCPSDMNSSRSIVEETVRKANEQYGTLLNCHLEVKYWSKDVLFTNGNPQELINRGIIDNADLVIALFGEKLGTPTVKAESGTVEEIKEMIEKGKDTIVCFSDKNITFNTSNSKMQIKEWIRLQDFKENYQGLYVSFKTNEELAKGLENQIRLFLKKRILSKMRLKQIFLLNLKMIQTWQMMIR